MADQWHVNWLKEGVKKWNARRKKVKFRPDLSDLNFFEILPPDFRDSPKTSRYFERIDLSDADLGRSDLSRLNFSKANFSGADLQNANLSKSNFQRCNFSRADLSQVTVYGSIFNGAEFESTDLKGVSFEDTSLKNTLFIDAFMNHEQEAAVTAREAKLYPDRDTYRSETVSLKANAIISVLESPDRAKKADGRTQKNKYDVYFATNRRRIFERGELVDFDGSIEDNLSYGVCEVIVPEGHRIGSLGSPRWKRIFNRNDDRLSINSLIELNDDLFWSLISQQAGLMKLKERPTIFVHGYNNTFKDAVLRAAQIGFDLGLGHGIGLFSWPSKGNFYSYSADETAAEASKYALAEYIEQFVENSSQGSINIISHSMGCRTTLGAAEVLSNGRKRIIKSINQIILAAADVDSAIMRKLGTHAVTHAKRTTSYVCDKDQALKVSGWLHSFPRVGISPPTFLLTGMDTILVNDLDLGNFSHGYIGSSKSILSDVYTLLKYNAPPNERHTIEEIKSDTGSYWRMRN